MFEIARKSGVETPRRTLEGWLGENWLRVDPTWKTEAESMNYVFVRVLQNVPSKFGRDHRSLDSFSSVSASNGRKYRLGLKSKNAGVAGTMTTSPC